MYLFNAGLSPNGAPYAGATFDDLLPDTPASRGSTASTAFLNPHDLAIKRESDARVDSTPTTQRKMAGSPSASDGSSHESSSSSTKHPSGYASENYTTSPSVHGTTTDDWGTGISGLKMPTSDDMFGDTEMSGLDADFEVSNQQMASDFDFDTAASTPSGYQDTKLTKLKTAPAVQSFQGTHTINPQRTNLSPRLPAAQAPFYFGESRESSPLNAMLPTQTQSSWSKHSPSSGLEETFNGITMNGDSPGNATFCPSLQFPHNGFSFDPESSATPSSFGKDLSSPPSTVNSHTGQPELFVYPTSLKSRVETQIPIKMILAPLPTGVTKLRLPTHTISKPKFLAKPEAERSPEILELHTSLVCTSAMQDRGRLDRAWARARGEDAGNVNRPSPASSLGSHSSKDDEEKPLNGGEVKICSGCIQRERKRASRKKQKKADEEELFQKDEEKRVIVFNTNEIKEWVEPSKDSQGGISGLPNSVQPSLAPGAMQVELPMRIACYCRHQNEKLGFQVIFTIKDYTGKFVAQAMTNSIMITDDHKTHNGPPPVTAPTNSLPNAPQLPGAGVFQSSGLEYPNTQMAGNKMFKQSFSTTDLSGLQHNFNPNFPMTATNTPFAVPSGISTRTSATLTPRNLSRPASPSGPSGPTTKRRKQSGSGKIPSNLTMTRLETSQYSTGTSTIPNSAATSPFPTTMSMMNHSDRGFAVPNTRQAQYGTSPLTPNSHDTTFLNGINGINRSFSLENLPRQAVISAPSSRQPSRPGTPGSNRNSFGTADTSLGQAVSSQLFGQPSRRPPPLIHKLVPAEGSVTGGTEVTLLGNGFYQGLEVMFGDTEATTTTFWGEKCLNCIAPPALQPGTVTVVFKHEHHQYISTHAQTQSRHPVFTYTDDREHELFKMALQTLSKQIPHLSEDPYSAAQQLLGGHPSSFWPMQGGYGGNSGHHRQANATDPGPFDLIDLESNMLAFLKYLDRGGISDPCVFEARRPSGLTLLHLAASLGLTRFVAGMLSRGAPPDELDNNGNTPMHHAAMNGHTHIIHRLRVAGADNRIRSIRNFTPADLATSLLSHQAAVIPSQHYRSRSAGGTPMGLRSRNASSSSLRAFWDSASTSYAYSDDSEETDTENISQSCASLELPMGLPQRPSMIFDNVRSSPSARRSRQGSGAMKLSQPVVSIPDVAGEDQSQISPPAAFMIAWRDHIAAQINQFHESAHWTLPHLPTLPTLPTLPDYQAYPMVRRVSSLFPQRPGSRPPTAAGSKEGWWETLTRSSSPSAPPAYNELYPERITAVDFGVKKASSVQAAADAALDQHYETLSSSDAAASGSGKPNHRKTTTSPSKGLILTSRTVATDRPTFNSDRTAYYLWVSQTIIAPKSLLILCTDDTSFSALRARAAVDLAWRLVDFELCVRIITFTNCSWGLCRGIRGRLFASPFFFIALAQQSHCQCMPS
jgi:hypothetical protein